MAILKTLCFGRSHRVESEKKERKLHTMWFVTCLFCTEQKIHKSVNSRKEGNRDLTTDGIREILERIKNSISSPK